MAGSSLRERQRWYREAEIVRMAAEMIAADGCRAFTMDGLARRLGTSKASLYRAFAGRRDLLAKTVGEGLRAAVEEARATASAGEPARAFEFAARCLVERCLGFGADGAPLPCCLDEMACPFADWAGIDASLIAWDPKVSDRLHMPAETMRALCGVVRHHRRKEGLAPTRDDVEGIVGLLAS